MFEIARDSKASLFDNVDAFGKQQSKIKQEKGDRKIHCHQKRGKPRKQVDALFDLFFNNRWQDCTRKRDWRAV